MSDWKTIVSTVAPSLGTALGGPLAGTAVAAIVNALGIAPEPHETPEQAAAKYIPKATPEDLLKVKEAEDKFVTDMAKLGIDILTLETKDRDSARARESAIKDSTPRVLAYITTVAFLVVCVFILGGWTKTDSVLAGTVIGYVAANAQQVMAYYFGSSSGSDLKTRLMGLIDRKGAA